MKTFTKRLALVMGLLFTALICCGIVYIDTVNNYWQFSGGFIRLVVNTNAQASITIGTNNLEVGINTNAIGRSIMMAGRKPATNSTATGASALNFGGITLAGGSGGETTIPTIGTGGAGATMTIVAGVGGGASSATTNSTGGSGGAMILTGGAGGGATSVATNAAVGGNGGGGTFTGGAGGATSFATTNAVGGSGGSFTMSGGAGGTPSGGWSRLTGNGGNLTLNGGASGSSTRTNSGDAGNVTINGGAAGNVSTAPGDPGIAGNVHLNGGAGGTGATNGFGGSIYALGGDGGSTAQDGDVVLARSLIGTARGGVAVGPLISGGSVSITNVLGGSASLDFPSTVAGAFSELTIAVTGVTSNNCSVAMSIPWQMAQTGGAFTSFASNDVIYCRFINNQLVAIDPSPGTVSVVVFRIR